jgi:hypothetical protein
MPATESNWNSNRNRREENHSVMGERKSPPFLFAGLSRAEGAKCWCGWRIIGQYYRLTMMTNVRWVYNRCRFRVSKGNCGQSISCVAVEGGEDGKGTASQAAEKVVDGAKSTPWTLKREHIINELTARLKLCPSQKRFLKSVGSVDILGIADFPVPQGRPNFNGAVCGSVVPTALSRLINSLSRQ